MATLSPPSNARQAYPGYFYNNPYTPVARQPEYFELPPTPGSQDAFLSPPSTTTSFKHRRGGSAGSISDASSQRTLVSNGVHEHHPSALMRFLEYFVPLLGTLVLSTGLAMLAGFSSSKPIVAPFFVQQLGLADPKVWTAIFTVLSTLLSAALGFCYTTAVRIVIRKWVVARSQKLKTLSGWLDLHSASLSTVKGPLWFIVTGMSIILLGAITTCVNTLISPIPVPISTVISTAEPDLASGAFSDWYLTNGSTPQCSWWVSYRDGLQPTCVVGNSLPALLDTGRAAVNVDLLSDSGYTYFGKTVFSGTTGGVLPISPEEVKSNVGRLSPGEQLAVNSGLWNYTLDMQGLSALVACTNSSSSPLSVNASSVQPLATGLQVQSLCACGGQEPVTLFVGGNWVQAAVCEGVVGGSWNFYLRHYGEYDRDGYENLTCTITPYLSTARATYLGQLDQYIITPTQQLPAPDASIFAPLLAQLPQAVQLGQNTQNNLVLESVTAVTNAFYAQDTFAVWYPHVWEEYLKAWVEYIGTSTRLQYTSTQPAYSRAIAGSLTLSLYSWQFSPLNILFLSPILLLTLLTLGLALWALVWLSSTRLPTFDPTQPISLVVASAWCDEGLKAELERCRSEGCDPGESRARNARVMFRGGGLARVRKY
ncbi:hypothetical protein CALCODRAFT_553266 [Calocera cornea HHB12733]|uniref:Uncharacterized protein n=1 Tax=Calocera cornea HHB12733 TaxID=1353952 RepID=A0A165IYA3_9BASI|nr:hypothetical protein CALCODRAFT_553266 [Calocera cornea HHB12733]